MNNSQYLNEENYQKSNAKVRKTGKILLIAGIATIVIGFMLIILGFVGFGNTASSMGNGLSNGSTFGSITGGAFKNMGLFAIGAFANVLGFVLTVAGGMMTFMSHRRGITAYTVQQTMPIAKEGMNNIAPSVGNVAKEIAKGIKAGINDDKE